MKQPNIKKLAALNALRNAMTQGQAPMALPDQGPNPNSPPMSGPERQYSGPDPMAAVARTYEDPRNPNAR